MTWLLDYIPAVIIDILVIAGAIGVLTAWLFRFIPFIAQYRLAINVISIITLVIGVYFEGVLSSDNAWKSKILEAENKIAKIEKESAETNLKLTEALYENEKLRKDKKNATTKVITQIVTQYDSQCKLSNAFVQLHDSASKDAVPPSAEQINGGTTDVKASEVLTVVTENYSICYDIRDRLLAWQEWYRQQKQIYEQ